MIEIKEKNVDSQILKLHELAKNLENQDKNIDDLGKIKQLQFQKNYIVLQFSEIEFENAKNSISNFEHKLQTIKKDISTIGKNVQDKMSIISTAKPPILFGKKEYLDKIDNLRKEVEILKDNIVNLESKKTEIKHQIDNYKNTISLYENELEQVNPLFEKDEIKFEESKKAILGKYVQYFCSPPKKILEQSINGSFDNKYWKEYLTQHKGGYLIFDKIGWEYAFLVAYCFASTYEQWYENADYCIINNQTIKLNNLILVFLDKYIEKTNYFHDTSKKDYFFYGENLIEIIHPNIEILKTTYIVWSALLSVYWDISKQKQGVPIGELFSQKSNWNNHDLGYFFKNASPEKPEMVFLKLFKNIWDLLQFSIKFAVHSEFKEYTIFFQAQANNFENKYEEFKPLWYN